MKRFVCACAFAALGVIAMPQQAKAIPFTGSIDYVGTHSIAVPGDFTLNTMVSITSNVVLLSSGSIGGFIAPGSVLSHASPIVYVPPTVPGPPLWLHVASGVAFDLSGLSAVVNPLTLILSGSGLFKCTAPCAGYDDTPGFWVMTLNVSTGQVTGTFSSSASVPEPGVLAMLGFGLIGVARAYRSRQRG
jgi:hypothetical protein